MPNPTAEDMAASRHMREPIPLGRKELQSSRETGNRTGQRIYSQSGTRLFSSNTESLRHWGQTVSILEFYTKLSVKSESRQKISPAMRRSTTTTKKLTHMNRFLENSQNMWFSKIVEEEREREEGRRAHIADWNRRTEDPWKDIFNMTLIEIPQY